jgi:hypothetical protein
VAARKPKPNAPPDFLRLTPKKSDTPEKTAELVARRAVIAEQQEALRAEARQRGRIGPEARKVQLGLAHETSARADVAMLTSELQIAKGKARTEKSVRLDIAKARLADALAEQGRYDEAAAAANSPEQRAEYTAMWQAVWLDDDETCPCEPFVDGNMSLTHDHVAIEVISQKHGNRLMPAIRCNACGFVNVRPLTHELQQLHKARSRAAGLLQGRSAADLKHNAREILASLHDTKVLRR